MGAGPCSVSQQSTSTQESNRKSFFLKGDDKPKEIEYRRTEAHIDTVL